MSSSATPRGFTRRRCLPRRSSRASGSGRRCRISYARRMYHEARELKAGLKYGCNMCARAPRWPGCNLKDNKAVTEEDYKFCERMRWRKRQKTNPQ